MLALSSFCWGTDIHSDNFKELCNIYAAATRALNEMHSAADWEQTQKVWLNCRRNVRMILPCKLYCN